jgi:hypothetical protein
VSSQAHKQVDSHLKIHVKKIQFTMKRPVPVQGSGCEQTQGHEL